MTASSGHVVRAVAPQRQLRGVDGLDGAAMALRSMQGIWTRPADRVAGQTEVVLHGDLRGVLAPVRGVPPSVSASAAAAIDDADADLALAPDLGAGDRSAAS